VLVISSDETADVIIVGAGLTGLCAAIEAGKSGLSAVLLESQPELGGSAPMSAGFFAFAGTPLQKIKSVDDNPALLLKDLVEGGQGESDDDLLSVYANRQLELYNWLGEQGVKFDAVGQGAGQSVARNHWTDSKQLVKTLIRRCESDSNIRILRHTKASRLTEGPDNSGVTGCVVEQASEKISINSRGGVFLTTGGFASGPDLLQIFAPLTTRALPHAPAGSTGDGLKMAWKLGAGLRDMGRVHATFGAHPDSKRGYLDVLAAYYSGGIIVNKDGERFVDESVNYKELGDAALLQPDGLSFQIFDQTIMQKSISGELSSSGALSYDFNGYIKRGLVFSANTVRELAILCGINPDVLSETLVDYNASVESGVDRRFGRRGLCNGVGALAKLESAPFFAFPSRSFLSSTYCGLTIDRHCRVMDVFGDPIRGLYAAGEVTGGFHGAGYMSGTAHGKGALFGKIGIQSIARSLAEAVHSHSSGGDQ
jgi:fumarate reductase flavoprotein subunit